MQTTTARPELPSCFAREWDKNAPECAGGRDSTYTHPVTGLNIREQCQFFNSCGARVQARQISNGFVPASQLVRPPVLTPPPTTMGDALRRQQAEFAEQQRLAGLTYRPAMAVPAPQAGAAPQHVPYHPGATYHLNYEMPPYLSTPEERLPGETLKQVLLREIIRSIFKAIGHSVAYFFDTRRIKEKS